MQSFKLILVDLPYESQKYKLCNIELFKFTAYSFNAYISLQKTTNLMFKHIARSHFLGSLYERGSPILRKHKSQNQI